MSVEARLPAAVTVEAFDAVVADEAVLRPGVDALCRSLGVETAGLARFPTGSLPVYGIGQLVLKLFPPVYAGERPVEAGVLTALAGRLPVATPLVHAAGEHQGWGYVLMDRLPGVDLAAVWPGLGRGERTRLATQVGAAVRALHQVAPPVLEGPWPPPWAGFVADQRTSAVHRHRLWGLPEHWLDQVPGFLDGVDLAPGAADELVLLHTEVMPANLLAAQDPSGRWSLSGLCDVEPAMRGQREYEFVAIGIFLAQGDPGVLGAALSAYGYRSDQLDGALARRLMAWTLLHRCGNLATYLPRLPPPSAPTLDALAARWFSTHPSR